MTLRNERRERAPGGALSTSTLTGRLTDVDLVGIAEIAKMLGVTRQRASKISQGGDFPKPKEKLAMGPIWSRRAIERWAERRGRTLQAP